MSRSAEMSPELYTALMQVVRRAYDQGNTLQNMRWHPDHQYSNGMGDGMVLVARDLLKAMGYDVDKLPAHPMSFERPQPSRWDRFLDFLGFSTQRRFDMQHPTISCHVVLNNLNKVWY